MSRLLDMMGHYEGFLAKEQAREEEDPAAVEHTLFCQLTSFEMVLLKYSLEWLQVLYPNNSSIHDLHEKLMELAKAQDFCECSDCRRERGEID